MIHAYLFDEKQTLLPNKIEIEHIFPRKWQDTNYNGWNINDAKQHLEQLGNKIIFEKLLNIQAGNGYFGKKKEHYK
ncbi:GmrSD restriction endonuclease domain-containing protein, partial [Kingella kingae]